MQNVIENNKDLLRMVTVELESIKVQHTKGHRNNMYNMMADYLANEARIAGRCNRSCGDICVLHPFYQVKINVLNHWLLY